MQLQNETNKLINSCGDKRTCYVCGRTFNRFTKYQKGSGGKSDFRKQLHVIGSDVDNFGCMFCGSTDRERHLYMFFDKLQYWDMIRDAEILHFAPEKNLSDRISRQSPKIYIKADLYPENETIRRIDATDIPFDGETFNFVIANHILEHIPDYMKALSEFYRVLKPGGIAVLQTPFSRLLKNNFEDENINTDELRSYFHGQHDHLRTFGENHLLESIKNAGFDLQIQKHKSFFDDQTAHVYGVNREEDLIQALKPFTSELNPDIS